ncbi:MAG: TAT-variant-translocated molybdopterin oxidoreductase [Chitinophagales bacterium]
MSQKKYWQSFGEVNDAEHFQKKTQDEFREELPFEDIDGKLSDAKSPRRDFLKYLGFSTAAAALAASCKTPVRKAVPFANRPENVIPGEAKYYATTYVQDGDVVPILAKVRDGRPIKIEGNELSLHTNGGTSARAQASVLDLYDMYRNRFPTRKVGDKYEESTYEFLDKTIGDALTGLTGKQIVFLSSTIVSPSAKDIISKFANLKHVQYDAVSYSGMLLANEASGFGRKLPSYNFDIAKVIVSIGADFLATWLSPLENAVGYSRGRKIDEKNPAMSKHYQFESHLSTTGASADERFTHRPSETGAVALALLNALDGSVTAPSLADTKLKAGIAKVAADLKANNGRALVVCGSNDMNVQVIVNAINNAVGANGTTIDWAKPVNYRQGIDKDINDLVTEMDAGNVGAIFIYGANPAYDYHSADKFKTALAKVKVSVSFSERWDETTQLCIYNLPTHHYLESWGDAEPKTGITSFIQPTIYPLFKTRPYQTSLLRWSGNNTNYEDYFKTYWTTKLGSEDAFNKALQDGITGPVVPVSTVQVPVAGTPAVNNAVAGTYNGGPVAAASSAIASAKKGGKYEVVLYQKVSIGAGSGATNPWLQELPDPISKACWDNYAMISMASANELGVKLNMEYEYYPKKPVFKFDVGNKTVELPVLVIPGMNANTIAIAVGYGRSEKLGKTAMGAGQNAYPFASFNGNTVDYFAPDVAITDLNRKQKIAQSQIHNWYEDRIEVVRETTLASFKKNPDEIPAYRKKMEEDFAKSTGDFRREATIYPDHLQPGVKWGMSIDMNACYGCGACVVACHAENNVPVVGKSEVLRYHDMHWLRIDRYFVSDEKNPDDLKGVVFQPMLCQHCDNAPCENVCPVAATNHSSEGINQMAYNRCIGTRYCANNCPYKVRRFNWSDYMGADSFPDNQDQWIIGKLDPVVHQMNEDLTRMVLNPDVTVRSRGVMEKCTFCIQRTQEAKLKAKKDNRLLVDGDAKTACQQACAANAIVFGNAHDKTSQVSRIREENPQRSFYVIEQLHTLPNITYLEKVRNTEEIIERGEHHGEGEVNKVPTGEPEKAAH